MGLADKGCVIKVCNSSDLEPLDLLNDLALGCCQMSHDLLIVLILHFFIRWTIYIYMYTNTTLQWALSKPENKISGISIVCVCILMMQVDLIHQF